MRGRGNSSILMPPPNARSPLVAGGKGQAEHVSVKLVTPWNTREGVRGNIPALLPTGPDQLSTIPAKQGQL